MMKFLGFSFQVSAMDGAKKNATGNGVEHELQRAGVPKISAGVVELAFHARLFKLNPSGIL